MNLDYLEAIRSIVAVADTGSATAAARQLGTSQSNVSRRLSTLKRFYGSRLTVGAGKGFALTDAGLAVARHGRAILRHETAIRGEFKLAETGAEGEWEGTVRVACPVSLLRARLLGPVRELLAKHPELRLDLVQGTACDVSVAAVEACDGADDGEVAGWISHATVASPVHLARVGAAPSHPRDLERSTLIVIRNAAGAWSGTWDYTDGGQVVLVTSDRTLGVPTTDVALDAALADEGIARLPSYVVHDHVAAGRLVPVLAVYEPAPRALIVMVDASSPATAAIEGVANHLRAAIWRDPALARREARCGQELQG